MASKSIKICLEIEWLLRRVFEGLLGPIFDHFGGPKPIHVASFVAWYFIVYFKRFSRKLEILGPSPGEGKMGFWGGG